MEIWQCTSKLRDLVGLRELYEWIKKRGNREQTSRTRIPSSLFWSQLRSIPHFHPKTQPVSIAEFDEYEGLNLFCHLFINGQFHLCAELIEEYGSNVWGEVNVIGSQHPATPLEICILHLSSFTQEVDYTKEGVSSLEKLLRGAPRLVNMTGERSFRTALHQVFGLLCTRFLKKFHGLGYNPLYHQSPLFKLGALMVKLEGKISPIPEPLKILIGSCDSAMPKIMEQALGHILPLALHTVVIGYTVDRLAETLRREPFPERRWFPTAQKADVQIFKRLHEEAGVILPGHNKRKRI